MEETTLPQSSEIAAKGIHTADQFISLMSALMSDVIAGRMTPGVTHAAVNAGGKMLKAAEMQMRYGTGNNGRKVLVLSPPEIA